MTEEHLIYWYAPTSIGNRWVRWLSQATDRKPSSKRKSF
jgi:hypothetical protein